jgi:hypothetical protein
MAMWLYQMDQRQWPPNSYRLDIWENERWSWPIGRRATTEQPSPGDRIVFFYAPSGGSEPGFYGWAIVLDMHDDERGMYFRPVTPSDHLKMHPWWDADAKALVDKIRGKVKQGTLWQISEELAAQVTAGMTAWFAGRTAQGAAESE